MIDSLSPDLVSCTQAIYSHGGGKTRVLQKSIDLGSSGPSEVHSCLKSLSPGLKLPERLSTQIENRGFGSRRSLAYVKSEDLHAFFQSPDKLLLCS